MRGGGPGRSRSVGAQIIALVVLSTAGVGGILWHPGRSSPAPIGVVIITLDTTRADRLPVYGFMDAAMPHLERLAREGVVFDRATSVAPLTLPAHCSLFTGLFPPAHGVRDNSDRPLSPHHTTLAEALRGRGFRTAGFVGSIVLDADRGLAQGFDHYAGVVHTDGSKGPPRSQRRRADEVITDAIRWIDGVHDSPFFVWAHLYDPHRPYSPPEPYRSMHPEDPYVAEIAFADAQIGRLVEALERRGLLERTVVIVAGDHGESMGEHGERDHGIFVYESVLHVPLIIRAPNVSARRVADVVRLVDVMPTVLDLMRVSPPPSDGVSLVGMLQGAPQPVELEAYAESQYPLRFGWSPLRSLRTGRYKLIDAPRPELYDLDRDPFEQRNIHHERTRLARAMAQRLEVLYGVSAADRHDADSMPAAELQLRLTSLGYIGSGASSAESQSDDLPDPKDCIDPFSKQSRAAPCATKAGAWPVPIGQLLMNLRSGSTR